MLSLLSNAIIHGMKWCLRRLPKYQGRLHDQNSLVHRIAVDAHIDIKHIEKKLSEIQNILRKP